MTKRRRETSRRTGENATATIRIQRRRFEHDGVYAPTASDDDAYGVTNLTFWKGNPLPECHSKRISLPENVESVLGGELAA